MALDDAYTPGGTSTESIFTTTTGATPASPGVNARTTGQEKPNRRQQNPLGNFSSYTYQLSLYMITSDAYDAFMDRNRTNIDLANPSGTGSGAYLIAQSGGINNDVTPRAPGFVYDYYIDDLRIKQAIHPQATGTSSATTEIGFTITEPFGFSFISNLKTAANMIADYDSTIGASENRNSTKQTFILGIKFLGYDADGKVLTNSETSGLFERYWDIVFTSVKYKIDGRTTVYTIKAAAKAIRETMGLKRGLIDLGATVKGRTVEDVLRGPTATNPSSIGLFTKLTVDQEQTEGILQPNRYFVEFIGPDADAIRKATIKSAADTDKTQTVMSNVKNVYEVNAKAETEAVPDLTSNEIRFERETPILQALKQILSQSSYIEDALKVVATTELETDTQKNSPDVVKPDTKKPLKWFNISTKVSNPRYDVNVGDYAYDITYIIQSYSTPVVVVPNGNSTTPYYGPIKRYDYWFTGKNSEVLRYEQSLDNSYFNVVLAPDGSPESHGGEAAISSYPNKRTSMDRLGKMNIGAEVQNQYATQLIDPGSYAKAKIEILGDPDWLVAPSPGNINDFDQFYGPDGFSVNPNAGQVFIEVDFKEAVDYDTNLGIMKRNEDILFWNYPEAVKKELHGISYMVIAVTSSFKGGKFTQELDCVINTFGNDSGVTPAAADQREESNQAAIAADPLNRESTGDATTPTNSTATNSTGLPQNPPVQVSSSPTLAETPATPIGNSGAGYEYDT